MTPPSSLENCPQEIRDNPRPYDECTPPNPPADPSSKSPSPPPPPSVSPEHTFRYFSIGQELLIPLVGNADKTVRQGFMALFRPWSRIGIGAQFDTTFGQELTFHGRMQGAFWLDRYGAWRLNTAGLIGFRELFGQKRILENGAEAPVAGMLLSTGLELGLEGQLIRELSFSPFARFLVSPGSELSLDENPQTKVKIPNQFEFSIGLRINADLFPNR